MKIFKIKPDLTFHSLLPSASDFFRTSGAVFSASPKAERWEAFGDSPPDFYVREPRKTKSGNFSNLAVGCLAFDEVVRLGRAGELLAAAGEVLPATLDGEPLWIFNDLVTYDCFDFERSKFRMAGTVVVEVFEHVFKSELIGEGSVFKAQVQQNTTIYTVADRGNPDNEFYHVYQKTGLSGLLFEEVWAG